MTPEVIAVGVAGAIAVFYAGYRYGAKVIPQIVAELDKVEATASTDAKNLVAKIKALL